MPPLANSRHERFAQELATGKTAEEAYQIAGYRGQRCNAARMKTKKAVRQRVAEIQGRASLRSELTLMRLIQMAIAAYEKAAQEARGASAMVSAVKELGILSGKRVERSEHKNLNYDANELTDDELVTIIEGECREGASEEEENSVPVR